MALDINRCRPPLLVEIEEDHGKSCSADGWGKQKKNPDVEQNELPKAVEKIQQGWRLVPVGMVP